MIRFHLRFSSSTVLCSFRLSVSIEAMAVALRSQIRGLTAVKSRPKISNSCAELLLHFLLPLRGKAGRGDDQRALGLPPLCQGLPDHAGLDRLAQPHFIGQQETASWTGHHAVRGKNLVREDFGAGIGKLARPCCP